MHKQKILLLRPGMNLNVPTYIDMESLQNKNCNEDFANCDDNCTSEFTRNSVTTKQKEG